MKNILFNLTLAAALVFVSYAMAYEGMKPVKGMGEADPEQATAEGAGPTSAMRLATEEDVQKLPNVGNKLCPVTGNPVDDGSMGETVKYVYNGKIYNLCCKMCAKDFKNDPEKYSTIAEKE